MAWGEPDRADQTLSVAKTYLAILGGIAHFRGLLDPSERVSDRLTIWHTWLNRDGRMFADASRASWFMFGAGAQGRCPGAGRSA